MAKALDKCGPRKREGSSDPEGVSAVSQQSAAIFDEPSGIPSGFDFFSSHTPSPVDSLAPGLDIVGADLRVPLVTGATIGYANLDYAASAPCLRAVQDAVVEVLPWYSSVHRGAGLTSRLTTKRYEQARESIKSFLAARPDDELIFTRNSTDSLNLLAHALPIGSNVVVFETEHHASLLPWRRRHRVRQLPIPHTPAEAVSAVAAALQDRSGKTQLVCVAGASNVTGEVWPVADIAEVAHRYGARIAVDAAQLAPHRTIDLGALDVDYLALSGHKLYAPFGTGVLIGRRDWLCRAEPYLAGGGATRRVFETTVEWADVPDRHEAGTPNVMGVIALAAACDALAIADRRRLQASEAMLLDRLRSGLSRVDGVVELSLWGQAADRIGVVALGVPDRGISAKQLAAALSAEYGIGVRDGAFCAHLCVDRLLSMGEQLDSSALRVSIGIGTTLEHVDRCVNAIQELVAYGPRWSYVEREGQIQPDPDPRFT